MWRTGALYVNSGVCQRVPTYLCLPWRAPALHKEMAPRLRFCVSPSLRPCHPTPSPIQYSLSRLPHPLNPQCGWAAPDAGVRVGSSADAPGPVAPLDESRPEAAALSAQPSFKGPGLRAVSSSPRFYATSSAPDGVPITPVPYPSFCSRPAESCATMLSKVCPCLDTTSSRGCSPRTAVSRDRLASLLGTRWHNVPLLTRRRP